MVPPFSGIGCSKQWERECRTMVACVVDFARLPTRRVMSGAAVMRPVRQRKILAGCPGLPVEQPRERLRAGFNPQFTVIRDLERSNEGSGMSTRRDDCAIRRAAAAAGSGRILILGGLLILISP